MIKRYCVRGHAQAGHLYSRAIWAEARRNGRPQRHQGALTLGSGDSACKDPGAVKRSVCQDTAGNQGSYRAELKLQKQGLA